MVRRFAVAVFGASVVVALIAGCTSSGGATDPAKIEGAWRLESFGGTTRLEPADRSVDTWIELSGGKASGSGGVNSFGGTYKASAGKIAFGDINATLIAGPEPAMTQEGKFFSALQKTRGFEINDGKLVLSDLNNDVLVVLAPK